MASSALLNEQRLAGGVPLDDKTSAPQTYRFCYPPILHFGDPEREYQAAKSEAVLFDVNDRAQIEMTGKDARQFLNNLCTNDNNRLGTEEGCEAFVTNVKGRIHFPNCPTHTMRWHRTLTHARWKSITPSTIRRTSTR